MMKKLMTGVVTAAALLVSVSAANAATSWFSSGNGNHVGNTYEFTGSDGTDHTASVLNGWNGGIQFFGGTLQQSVNGLNICNGSTYYGGCYGDDHEIDGYYNEGVNLTFEKEVQVEKIYFTYVDSNDYFWFNVDDGSWSNMNIPGIGFTSFTFAPSVTGTSFDIAAVYDGFWGTDNFKLKGVEYTVSSVPLPPAVLMFGAALLGLGWVKRRKQAQAA